jgi:site-specific recombinase XerD
MIGASSDDAKMPRNSAKPGSTLLAALNWFVLYLKDEKHASRYTLINYQRDLLVFVQSLDHSQQDHELRLDSVTPEQIHDHMRALIDRGLAKASVRRAMYTISSFFGWAYRWELVGSNPTARVTVPRRERVREVRDLSRRERALLLAAADRLARESRRPLDAQAPLLVRLMLKTGLRRGEVLRLCWRDVDLERRELFVRHGKGDKSRAVPIEDKDLLDRLANVRKARASSVPGHETSTVFVGTRGQPLSETMFYKIFHRVVALAELDGVRITPHALRHTFGSMLCARGVPVPSVMDLMGHEDIGTTMLYVHTTPEGLRAAVKKLGE